MCVPYTLRSDEVLGQAMFKLLDSSISANTKTAYRSGLFNFVRFMTMYGLCNNVNELPVVSEPILLYYVAYCFKSLHLKYSTIKLYLAAIRWEYVARGYKNPLVDDMGQPLLQLQGVLKGVRKLQGHTVSPRLPITMDILHKMCYSLRRGMFGSYVDLLMETVCTVAFFGFLRCGEFTSDDNIFRPDQGICIGDIKPSPEGQALILTLKTSKTDPFRQGVDIYLCRTGSIVCPWRALSSFITLRRQMGGTAGDPLFITPNRVSMSRTWFIGKLQELLTRIGLKGKFSGHSFRSGAATTAARAKIPDHLIKTLGRWTSDCYTRYVKLSKQLLYDAQRKMCSV